MFKPNIEKMKIKKNIKGLIKTLNHSNSKFRMEAAVVLGNLKEKEAVEPLIQALDDEDINVIKAAICSLEKIGDIRAVDSLVVKTKRNFEDIKSELIEAILNMGPPAVARSIDILVYGKQDINTDKISIILKMMGKPAIDYLTQNLVNASSYWPPKLKELLVMTGRPAVKPLLQILGEKDKIFKYLGNKDEPENILINMGEEAVEPLMEALKNENSEIKKISAKILGEIGDKRAVEPLIQSLKIEKDYIKRTVIEVLGN